MSRCVFLNILASALTTLTALAGTPVWQLDDPVTWYDWNAAGGWSAAPTSADTAYMVQTVGQTSNVRINDGTRVELTSLSIGSANITAPANVVNSTTGRLEVCKGGALVLSGGNLYLNGLGVYDGYSWQANRRYGELIVSGGVVSNLTSFVAGGYWRASIKGTDDCCLVKMTDGEIYAKSGILFSNANWDPDGRIGGPRYYIQTGGKASSVMASGGEFRSPGNGRMDVSGGTLSFFSFSFLGPTKITGGVLSTPDVSISYCRNSAPDCHSDLALVLDGGRMDLGILRCDKTGARLRLRKGVLALKKNLQLLPDSGAVVEVLNEGADISEELGFQLGLANGGAVRYVQTGGSWATRSRGLFAGATAPYVEIAGGSFTNVQSFANAGIQVDNASVAGATFCIRGTPVVRWEILGQRYDEIRPGTTLSSTNRLRNLYLIDSRGMGGLFVDSGTATSGSQNLRGIHTLHPYGGVQLLTTNRFTLVRSRHSLKGAGGSYPLWGKDLDAFLRAPDEGLWQTDFSDNTAKMWESTLAEGAEVANGFTSADGVPFGWFALPPLKREAEWLRVRLAVTPKAKTVAEIVADVNAANDGSTAVEEAKDGYNVRIDLPASRVGVGQADRKFLFDFTCEANPYEAKLGHTVTNALVTAFSFERPKTGLMLLLK